MIKLTALLVAISANTPVPCSSNPAAVRELTQELAERIAPEQRALRLTTERFGRIAVGECTAQTRRDLLDQAAILETRIQQNKSSGAAERVLTGALLNLIR